MKKRILGGTGGGRRGGWEADPTIICNRISNKKAGKIRFFLVLTIDTDK